MRHARKGSLDSHLDYHVNDGKSLDFIADESIDFVFSFDSLVHAEAEVFQAYLAQLAIKLKPNATGFIHHSNLASYLDPVTKELPAGFENKHWRATSMSAKVFEEYSEQVHLQCISQEEVNWGGEALNDVFSVFTRKGSTWSRDRRLQNPQFMNEANYIARLASLYSVRLSKVAYDGS